jgi:DNA-directed RNA polymerase specialized sigma24 family protein
VGRRPDHPPRQILPFGRPLPAVLDCVPNHMSGVPSSAFHTTSWTLVLAASRDSAADSAAALTRLCQTYWHPVYAFIRRRGYDPDQAQDLSQGFFALLLEKNYLQDADRERGRFRSFLLTSVKHFLANEWDRSHALKRGGGRVPIAIDVLEAERWYAPAAVEANTPERVFERRWAISLLEHVIAQLRAEFAATGKADLFDRLSTFLSPDADRVGYDEAAAQMNMSAGALRMAVHRLRRRYRALLRDQIAATVSSPEETDDEIRFLMATLSR